MVPMRTLTPLATESANGGRGSISSASRQRHVSEFRRSAQPNKADATASPRPSETALDFPDFGGDCLGCIAPNPASPIFLLQIGSAQPGKRCPAGIVPVGDERNGNGDYREEASNAHRYSPLFITFWNH
jgi:hypothetical protein